jgi:5-methylcytosine-specific restriction endonuclease McrA
MSDPENTFRALKDLPQFVDRWQCRVGWHRWTKWSEPQKKAGDVYFRQHRTCVDCGRVDVVKVNIPI